MTGGENKPDVFDVLSDAREALVGVGCERVLHDWEPCDPGKPSCDVCQALAAFTSGMVKAIGEVVEVAQVALDSPDLMTPVRRQLMEKRLAALTELLEEQRP